MGVIVLSAKMAKADGSVAADEVKAFKEAFKVSPADDDAGRLCFQFGQAGRSQL